MKTQKSRSQIIRRRRNILGAISGILGVLGFFVLLGTEGGFKQDMMGWGQAIGMSIFGLICIGLAVFGGYILDQTNPPKKENKK